MNARWQKATVLLLAAVFSISVLACGAFSSDSNVIQFQQVKPFGTVLTIEDLKAIGFKASKQYDVEGLTGALDAWLGFWGPAGSDRKDYEVRFYPSHEVAVSSGTAFAINRQYQTLRNNRPQVCRHVHEKLLPALFRKEVDDAIQCLVGIVGVQSRERQMSGLRELDTELHGFAIADLSEQDDVRCLAQ